MKKWSLFFGAFLDRLSLAIALVIFPPLFVDAAYASMFSGFQPPSKPILLGLLLAMYFLGQFLSNGLFGKLSDYYGRKPMLMITFMGSCVGFCVTALAIDIRSLFLLFTGRFVTGVFAANYVIALSAITDISTRRTKVKNFSLLEIAVSLGFTSAGLLGAVLSNRGLISWFSFSMPFWVVMFLIATNVVALYLFFEETLRVPKLHTAITVFSGFKQLKYAFSAAHLRKIFIFWVLFAFGWQSCLQFYSSLFLKVYHFLPSQIGWIFVAVGLIYMVIQQVLVKPISQKISSLHILKFAVLGVGICILGLILAPSQSAVLSVLLVYTVAIATASPNVSGAISNIAYEGEQGAVMGMMWVVQALAVIMASAVGGYLASISIMLPFVVGSIAAFLSWLQLFLVTSPEDTSEAETGKPS